MGELMPEVPIFVYGHIKTSSGQPISNAEIKIFDKDNYIGYVSVNSDSKGYYQVNIQSIISKDKDTINVQATYNGISSMNQFTVDLKNLPKYQCITIPIFNSNSYVGFNVSIK